MSSAAEPKKARGTIVLWKEICKGCSFCVDFCPTHCLDLSREYNPKGYHYPILARPEDCNGCDMCGLYCPDFAIFAVKFKDLAQRQPAEAAESEAHAAG